MDKEKRLKPEREVGIALAFKLPSCYTLHQLPLQALPSAITKDAANMLIPATLSLG